MKENFDLQSAINHLSKAIQFKTISYPNYEMDYEIFSDFLEFLESSYPHIHKKCPREIVNKYSPVYYWKGKDSKLKPLLLIAHYDVVPVEESTLKDWKVEPFKGTLKDDYVWGRGTLDNKNQLISVMESVEYLIEEEFTPERDIYFAFGFDEEIGGARGAKGISQYFEDKNIEFEAVIDEGGAIIEGMMEGLDKTAALVGVAEKGNTNIKISLTGKGGHSSMPPQATAIERLSKVIKNVNDNPMPARLTKPVKSMMVAMAPHMKGKTFALKNIETLFPIIKKVLEKNPVTNSLIRTTISFTMTGGGKAPNVLPQNAWAVANLRILQGDSIESTINHIKKVNPDFDLEIEEILLQEPSPISNMESDSYKKLISTIYEIYPDALVTPYLMSGGTDARHYYNLSNNIYRFMAVHVTQKDFDSIHSSNERISFENISNMINFYIKLIKNI